MSPPIAFPLPAWLLQALAARPARAPAVPPAHQALGAAELMAMSDHELKDLGLGRSEVPGLLAGEGREGRWR